MMTRARRLRVLRRLRGIWGNESGVTVVEYAVVLAFFCLLCIAGFTTLANNSNGRYSAATNTMINIQESPLPAVSP